MAKKKKTSGIPDELRERLIQYAEIETPEFATCDIVAAVRRYSSLQNIEIMAFMVSWACWDRQNDDYKAVENIETEFGRMSEPVIYIVRKGYEHLVGNTELFAIDKTWDEFAQVCAMLNKIYTDHNSMLDALRPDFESAGKGTRGVMSLDTVLSVFMDTAPGVDAWEAGSAHPWINRFYRWMCRPNSPVDLGIWPVDPSVLAVSLTPSNFAAAQLLGLTQSDETDSLTRDEVTAIFAEVFPGDPARGDYSLIGYTESKKKSDVEKEN